MSTIDEMFEEQLASEADPVCIIDKETRKITVPDEYKFFGVENDKRVERLKFECPKFVGDDDLDLTTCGLMIAYENANGEPGLYEVTDSVEAGDVIKFTWLLDEDVTKYKGNVKFIFYASKIRVGETQHAWNTTPAIGIVEEGLDAVANTEKKNPSIIETMLVRLAALEQSGGASPEQIGEAVRQYMEENGVGAPAPTESNFFVVNIDFNTNTASHSATEIRNAYESGKIVVTMDSYGMIMPLYSSDGESIQFEGIYEGNGLKKSVIFVSEDKSVIHYTENIVITSSPASIATVELLADNWVEEGENTYSQEVVVRDCPEGIDIRNCQVDLTPSREVLASWYEKDVMLVAENENGVITVGLVGQKLMSDYEVQVTLTEVVV